MLYSILPPALIVISLIAIIVFLMKKSDKVAGLNLEVTDEDLMGVEEAKKGLGARIRGIRWDDIRHFFLAIMEGLIRRLRVIFLKLETKSSGLSNIIREKRKQRLVKKSQERAAAQAAKQAALEAAQQNAETEKDDIIQKLRQYKPERPAAANNEPQETETFFRRRGFSMGDLSNKKAERPVMEQDEMVKPVISEMVAKSRRKVEIKDRLEELLIERIAINPRDIEAYERLGEYYLDIKSLKDAKECFKQVLKLNPGNRNAKYRMRRLENLLSKE